MISVFCFLSWVVVYTSVRLYMIYYIIKHFINGREVEIVIVENSFDKSALKGAGKMSW